MDGPWQASRQPLFALSGSCLQHLGVLGLAGSLPVEMENREMWLVSKVTSSRFGKVLWLWTSGGWLSVVSLMCSLLVRAVETVWCFLLDVRDDVQRTLAPFVPIVRLATAKRCSWAAGWQVPEFCQGPKLI